MDLSNITIFDWLKSKSFLKLDSDVAYVRIINDRALEYSDNSNDLTNEQKELLTADLYIELYFYPSQITESINDQGYSNSASVQTRAQEEYYNYAMAVYNKYDSEKYEEYTSNRTKIEKLDICNNW